MTDRSHRASLARMARQRERRFDRARRLDRLDPVADRVEIGRELLLFEFPWDMVRALELALFRTYAVPSIGRLLDRTGEFTGHTQKRYDDTQMLLYDLWMPGPLSDEGRVAAEHLNALHGHYRISDDDFRYTLATFVVVPVRWLQAYGWRRLGPVEVDGWTNLMRDMGEAMWKLTENDPADSPKMVMLSGSPPKAEMLRLTHWMAAFWSIRP